jgi:hypothetical protein
VGSGGFFSPVIACLFFAAGVLSMLETLASPSHFLLYTNTSEITKFKTPGKKVLTDCHFLPVFIYGFIEPSCKKILLYSIKWQNN